MKYNPFSRRMFLIGSGNAFITIPLLTSLLPREAEAQAAQKLRFLMITNGNSPNNNTFFGQTNASATALNLAQAEGNLLQSVVNYAPLSRFNGDISYILSPFTPYKDRIALIRGMDVLASENGAHPPAYPSAAAGYALVGGRHNSTGQLSIDAIIANKFKKPGAPDNRKQMILNPRYSGGAGSTGRWNQSEDSSTYDLNAAGDGSDARRVIRRTGTVFTKSILERYFGSVGSAPVADGLNRRSLLNSVFEDFTKLRSNPRLSAEDRRKLDAYMALVSDIEAGEQASQAAGSCGLPNLENDYPPPVIPGASNTVQRAATEEWNEKVRPAASQALFRNQIRLVVAAFACDLTRVCSYHIGALGSHGYHHVSSFGKHVYNSNAESTAYYASHLAGAKRVAQIMDGLAAFKENGVSLLDNSLIYWNQAYGTGGGHDKKNFPVLLAGGAGGKLRMGNYYDYRFTPPAAKGSRGLALNQLLITIMNCFGVQPSDYEYKPNQGYGGYDSASGDSYPAELKTLAAKRTPLPFLYKG